MFLAWIVSLSIFGVLMLIVIISMIIEGISRKRKRKLNKKDFIE